MTHDILIKGGQVVDGTGSEAKYADVAIKDGIIAEIGKVDGKAEHEIDAEGQTVTPGFVDIHTHLDAQIGWDHELRPVSHQVSPRFLWVTAELPLLHVNPKTENS
ncbi:MAG: hypothetical protein Ct9H300mP3_06700 [Gammaproteobacteria bacterium]|nr:MAG: hypothetical protein Ct9H300mP3_06700 [Gammaproteobacteria bacterium]